MNLEEKLLQGVSLIQPLGEMEHHVHNGPVVLGERGAPGNQQPSGAFETFLGSRQQMLLNISAHIVHRPSAVARYMKAVNHDFCLRKEDSGNITIPLVPIHHHLLHVLSVGEGTQVGLEGGNPSVRQNIQDTPFFGRSQDPLKSFTVCVALEFIKGGLFSTPKNIAARRTDSGVGSYASIFLLCDGAKKQPAIA